VLTAPRRSLEDFEGVWSLARWITHGDGTQARVEGQARWVRRAEGADYVETGTLSMPGQPPLMTERRYLWDAGLSVFFEDGRLFHRVPPAGGRVSHWCDPDRYEGLYDFSAWPVFEVSWTVSGPRKEYHMHTIYRRAAS
jgi:hypothetical protein